MALKKIISSAQTGVERAGLDAARKRFIFWGGTAIKGRLAEDGEVPSVYFSKDKLGCGLEESDRGRGFAAKHKNIIDSDATLILRPASMGRTLPEGIKLIIKTCRNLERPYRIFDPYKEYRVPSASRWICETDIEVDDDLTKKIETMNVVGPSESNHAGVYEQTLIFMSDVIGYVNLFNREGIKVWSLKKKR